MWDSLRFKDALLSNAELHETLTIVAVKNMNANAIALNVKRDYIKNVPVTNNFNSIMKGQRP